MNTDTDTEHTYSPRWPFYFLFRHTHTHTHTHEHLFVINLFRYIKCKDKKLHEETVFILGRMGNMKEALSILINELKNIREAIDFVQRSHDDALWEVRREKDRRRG